eukprot:40356-Amphidinium_carterae.1
MPTDLHHFGEYKLFQLGKQFGNSCPLQHASHRATIAIGGKERFARRASAGPKRPAKGIERTQSPDAEILSEKVSKLNNVAEENVPLFDVLGGSVPFSANSDLGCRE